MDERCGSLSSCALTAAVTRGWAWPTEIVRLLHSRRGHTSKKTQCESTPKYAPGEQIKIFLALGAVAVLHRGALNYDGIFERLKSGVGRRHLRLTHLDDVVHVHDESFPEIILSDFAAAASFISKPQLAAGRHPITQLQGSLTKLASKM